MYLERLLSSSHGQHDKYKDILLVMIPENYIIYNLRMTNNKRSIHSLLLQVQSFK